LRIPDLGFSAAVHVVDPAIGFLHRLLARIAVVLLQHAEQPVVVPTDLIDLTIG